MMYTELFDVDNIPDKRIVNRGYCIILMVSCPFFRPRVTQNLQNRW